jgi:hypothetical protein
VSRTEGRQHPKQVVVVSDLHAGCQMALCPPTGARLDSGMIALPRGAQAALWPVWLEFWQWVEQVTEGQPYDLVLNGDAIDGVHHGSTTQISHNIKDQERLACEIMAPHTVNAERYFHIRGTEAHVGQSAESEERVAEKLGAQPNEDGQHARYDLWLRMGGPKGPLVHFLHHIGTTGSSAYEATAVHKELVESFVEAGRWGDEPPQAIVRSHRHRAIRIHVPVENGDGLAVVTPAWQLKTPFAWKIPGARLSQPQIGGVVLKLGEEAGLYARAFTRRMARSQEV